jgi:hypothetical protein
MRSLRARDGFKYHQKRENMTKEDPKILKKSKKQNGQNWPVKKNQINCLTLPVLHENMQTIFSFLYGPDWRIRVTLINTYILIFPNLPITSSKL